MKLIKRSLIILMTFFLGMIVFSISNNVQAMTGAEMKQKLEYVENNVEGLKNGQYFTGSYKGYAWSCYGFANAVADEVFGSSHYTSPNDWQWYGNLDNLCIGDVIEYYEPASSSGTHCFIVTNLDGTNIEVTDSNGLRRL